MPTPPWLDLALASGATLRLGRLQGVDADGRLLVAPAEGAPAAPAAIGVDLDDAQLEEAAVAASPVLLACLEGQPPIVLAVLRERLAPGRARGRRKVAAARALELRCGKASITLRRDGKVVVRGTHVVSASSGPNKIKGASVALN